jgi:hypothetical protein
MVKSECLEDSRTWSKNIRDDMTIKRKQFLRRRLRDAFAAQPELKKLARQLLKLGGDFVVAPPATDPHAAELLSNGFVIAGPILLKAGRVGGCHWNVAKLWNARRHGIVGIGTGYGLTDDGLWRQHSWGILREGILETTESRTKYFGICLQGFRADDFSDRNS